MLGDWDPFAARPAIERIEVDGVELRPGDRVRLRPGMGGDILDLALSGKTATIESIEQDFEDQFHVAVTLDDDPGQDLGRRRKPGHRFFFKPDEVAPLGGSEARRSSVPRILVAGIGNIFLGDDAFGVEVVRRLAAKCLPQGVDVVDFGIRGCDLTYALLDGYATVILVDALPRGQAPGTLYVIEPEAEDPMAGHSADVLPETHSLNPAGVLQLVQRMGGHIDRLVLVGCEPSPLDGDDMRDGLSDAVAAAVDEAVEMVEALIEQVRETNNVQRVAHP